MALTKDVNSYVTVEEAEAYFEDRLDVAAWTEADVSQKPQALVTATAMLDALTWTGVAVSEVQPLAFPRVGDYFDPRIGALVTLGISVPSRVITATFELAYHLLNNDGLLDSTGGVVNLTMGPIKLEGIRATGDFPIAVRRVIKPLLVNVGANMWWRAN